jgi:hypothetical protein
LQDTNVLAIDGRAIEILNLPELRALAGVESPGTSGDDCR